MVCKSSARSSNKLISARIYHSLFPIILRSGFRAGPQPNLFCCCAVRPRGERVTDWHASNWLHSYPHDIPPPRSKLKSKWVEKLVKLILFFLWCWWHDTIISRQDKRPTDEVENSKSYGCGDSVWYGMKWSARKTKANRSFICVSTRAQRDSSTISFVSRFFFFWVFRINFIRCEIFSDKIDYFIYQWQRKQRRRWRWRRPTVTWVSPRVRDQPIWFIFLN